MRATWLRSIRDTVEWLSQERAVSTAIGESFEQIAGEWAHLPLPEAVPFSSGICPDGSPVELSVRMVARQAAEWRLIAQPWNYRLNARENLHYARERAQQFICAQSGHAAGAFVEQALSIYAADTESLPAGNFYLWLGIAVAADGSVHSTKLYLNPWAAVPHACPQTIYYLLSLSDPVAADSVMGQVHDLIAEARVVPHIVGFNFGHKQLLSAKLYLSCADIGLATLQRIVEKWPCADRQREDQEAQLEFLARAGKSSSSGEAHFTVAIKNGSSIPELRISLFAPHWFSTDQKVLQTLLQGNYLDNSIYHRLLSVAEASKADRGINFISMEARGPTIYFNVACAGWLLNTGAAT